MPFHFFLSANNSLHLLTPSTWRSLSTSSFLPSPSSCPFQFLSEDLFWASYPPPFSPGDLTGLSFALLSILTSLRSGVYSAKWSLLVDGFAFFTHHSSSSIGTTAHCGLWSVEQCPSIFSYLPPTLSIFSLPDLFLLPLSILSWVFPFFLSLPVLEWRSSWASYPPPFSLGDLTSLSFALLSILLYFLLCSTLLVLDSSDFSIPHFHI